MNDSEAKDVELHAYMSNESYQDHGGLPPQGWSVLADSKDLGIGTNDGFHAVAYQNDDHPEQVTVAYQGTDPQHEFYNDVLVNDREIAQHEVPAQYADAMSFDRMVAEIAQVPLSSIEQTGHSLGGHLGNLVAISTEAHSDAFNAPGVKEELPQLEQMNGVTPGTYESADHSSQIHAYNLEGDVVSQFGTQVGTVTTVENPLLPEQTERQNDLLQQSEMAAEMSAEAAVGPALQVVTNAAETASTNHSNAYEEAVLQDQTAQSRMEPGHESPAESLHVSTEAEHSAPLGEPAVTYPEPALAAEVHAAEVPVEVAPAWQTTEPVSEAAHVPAETPSSFFGDAFAQVEHLWAPEPVSVSEAAHVPAETPSSFFGDAFAPVEHLWSPEPVSEAAHVPTETPTSFFSDAFAPVEHLWAPEPVSEAAHVPTETPASFFSDAFAPVEHLWSPEPVSVSEAAHVPAETPASFFSDAFAPVEHLWSPEPVSEAAHVPTETPTSFFSEAFAPVEHSWQAPEPSPSEGWLAYSPPVADPVPDHGSWWGDSASAFSPTTSAYDHSPAWGDSFAAHDYSPSWSDSYAAHDYSAPAHDYGSSHDDGSSHGYGGSAHDSGASSHDSGSHYDSGMGF